MDDVTYTTSWFTANATITNAMAPIQLPHGASLSRVEVFGNDTGNTWNFSAMSSTSSILTLVDGVSINDFSEPSHTVDNSTSSYSFKITGMSTGDKIYGARITYTTDYD